MTALILLAGPLGSAAAVRRLARQAGKVICADGGARHARRLGLKADYLVGDLDSAPRVSRRGANGPVILRDGDQSRSDFEKALRLALRLGARSAWVAGAWGGRPDHELVNLALCERYAARLGVALVGRGEARLLGPGRHLLACRRGEDVTLLSATPRARVATRGLAYPLSGEPLERGSRGLSNRASAERVELRVASGRLWVVRPQAG